jgi:hypothetical protein
MEDYDSLQVIEDYFNQTDTVSGIDSEHRFDFEKQSEVFGKLSFDPVILEIKCEIESQLLVSEDYRDFSLQEIASTVAVSEPSEYYNCGGRIYILSDKFLTIFESLLIENYIAYPVTLCNRYSNRQWKNYFAVRFVGTTEKKLVTNQLVFVDKRSLVTYFREDVKEKLEKLKLANLAFDWIEG